REDLGLVNYDGGELMRIFKWRHPQHGPSVFGIVKGHALHDSGQRFKILSLFQLLVVHSRGYWRAEFPAQGPRKIYEGQDWHGCRTDRVNARRGGEGAFLRQFKKVIQVNLFSMEKPRRPASSPAWHRAFCAEQSPATAVISKPASSYFRAIC